MDYFEEKLHPSRAPSICKFPSLDECYQDKFDCNIILTPNSCLDEKQRYSIY